MVGPSESLCSPSQIPTNSLIHGLELQWKLVSILSLQLDLDLELDLLPKSLGSLIPNLCIWGGILFFSSSEPGSGSESDSEYE